MSEYLMQIIGYQVQNIADWRREKACQFPDEPRNLTAVEELDKLTDQIKQLRCSSEIHEQIGKLHNAVAALSKNRFEIWEDVNEAVSAELRTVGFHNGYGTSQGFLEWYRDLLKEKLHEQLNEIAPVSNRPA